MTNFCSSLNCLRLLISRKISTRFSSDSEADASELLENLVEMFSRYYMNSNVISRFT